MKKLLFFFASFLSLAVIFGAGWASGVGNTPTQPADVKITREDDRKVCPDEAPNAGRYGFRFKIPFPQPPERGSAK